MSQGLALRAVLILLFDGASGAIAQATSRSDRLELIRLAQEQVQLGHFETARVSLVNGLALLRAEGGQDALEAIVLNNLGDIANQQGQFRQAEAFYQRSIVLWDALGPEGRKAVS